MLFYFLLIVINQHLKVFLNYIPILCHVINQKIHGKTASKDEKRLNFKPDMRKLSNKGVSPDKDTKTQAHVKKALKLLFKAILNTKTELRVK
jgi:hypothetical protein